MESRITRAIVASSAKYLDELSEVDVLIVGAGPSGMVAARYLAERGYRVAVFERRFSFGGGIGPGGSMMPRIVVQEEAIPILRDFSVRYSPTGDGLYVVDPAELIAKLAVHAIDAGARFLLGVHVDDVVFRPGDPPRIVGVAWYWSPIHMAAVHVDPLFTMARAVVDATGHDAEVISVASRKVPSANVVVRGEASAFSEEGERMVVEGVARVLPGLYAVGMAVAAVHGTPRMAPIFGGMLMSGKRLAEVVDADLRAEAKAVEAG